MGPKKVKPKKSARGKFRSKNYPNLYLYPKRSKAWVYRRYSQEKREDFNLSTGETNERSAHDVGEKEFHRWLGLEITKPSKVVFADYAIEILDEKLDRPDSSFSVSSKRTSRNAIVNHLIPAFGHLRLEQINEDVWDNYCNDVTRHFEQVLGRPAPRFFNRRKELNEILRRAQRNGLLKRLPDLENPDGDAAEPRALSVQEYRTIRRALPNPIKLLAFVIFNQGPRPSEALRYGYPMISRGSDGTDSIAIPGSITKTRRARTIPLNSMVQRTLRWRKRLSGSPWVFPSSRTGSHLTSYNAVWDRTMEKLGMDYTIYNLRDTFITNRLESGQSDVFIAKYTDTSPEMIRRKYAVARAKVMKGVAG